MTTGATPPAPFGSGAIGCVPGALPSVTHNHCCEENAEVGSDATKYSRPAISTNEEPVPRAMTAAVPLCVSGVTHTFWSEFTMSLSPKTYAACAVDVKRRLRSTATFVLSGVPSLLHIWPPLT